MRLALIAALCLSAGCPVEGGECEMDGDCNGSLVCARDHECVDESTVRSVQVNWTINGAAATGSTCGDLDLYIEFRTGDPNDELGFHPVPCFAGQFSVDKLPRRFGSVELGSDDDRVREFATFDANGDALIDLVVVP
ncbi:MAG: hypothetical protein ABI867_42095 [Kofleriaceae bacterium]